MYFCSTCETYICEICNKEKDSKCPEDHSVVLDQMSSLLSPLFTIHICKWDKNGCQEKLHVKKLKDHEKYCIFQNVQCPVISCTESIVFKDAQKHLDETHKCLKVDDEWEFKGTQEEMIQNVCCLSSHGRQFFVQFQMYEKECGGIWKCGHQDKCLGYVYVYCGAHNIAYEG